MSDDVPRSAADTVGKIAALLFSVVLVFAVASSLVSHSSHSPSVPDLSLASSTGVHAIFRGYEGNAPAECAKASPMEQVPMSCCTGGYPSGCLAGCIDQPTLFRSSTCVYNAGSFRVVLAKANLTDHTRVTQFVRCIDKRTVFGEVCHEGDEAYPGYTNTMSGYPFPAGPEDTWNGTYSRYSPASPKDCGCQMSTSPPYGPLPDATSVKCTQGCRRLLKAKQDTCWHVSDPGSLGYRQGYDTFKTQYFLQVYEDSCST